MPLRLFQLSGSLAAGVLSLLATSIVHVEPASAAPSVNIAMNAAFPAPPYLVELLESAASENETSYFPLLDRITDDKFAKGGTDKELYDLFLDALQQDGAISGAEALSTFKLGLSMRSSAPRIEAHYQFYEKAVLPSLSSPQEQCSEWALIAGGYFCLPDLENRQAEIRLRLPEEEALPFDRTRGTGQVATMYGDIMSPTFASSYKALSKMAREKGLAYRLRYKRSASIDQSPLPVSGYGVELALKKTDYIVIDDRESDAEPVKPASSVHAQAVLGLEEEVADLKPLSSSELSHLGLSAAAFIAASENPLKTLLKVTQDFPKYSALFSGHNASQEFIDEHKKNSATVVPGGYNVLWMNGVQLIERQIESYTLVDLLRKERRLIDAVRALGLSGPEAISLLSHEEVTISKEKDDEVPRFDWRDDSEGGNVIMWLNNIEKDDRYESWPTDLYALFQRMMGGQIPRIRRDMFTLVVPIDFANPEDIFLVYDMLWGFVNRMVPIKFGFVPICNSGESRKHAKLARHILGNYGVLPMIEYLRSIHTETEVKAAEALLYEGAVKDHEATAEAKSLSFIEILESTHHEPELSRAKNWILRLGADSDVPLALFNGIVIPRSGRWMGLVSQRLAWDLQVIQRQILMGGVDDSNWIPGLFLQRAMKQRNIYVIPDSGNPLRMVDVHKIYDDHDGVFSKLPIVEPDAETTKEHWAALTVVSDLFTDDGLEFLLRAVEFRQNNPGIRMDIIHNPAVTAGGGAAKVTASLSGKEAALLEVSKIDEIKTLVFEKGAGDSAFDAALERFLEDVSMQPGTQNLILNGRIIGPIGGQQPFNGVAFQQFFEFEQSQRILPVYKAADALGIGDKVPDALGAAKLTSVTAISGVSDLPEGIFDQAPRARMNMFQRWGTKHVFISAGDCEAASIQFTASLNPASEQAQRWVPMLKTLSELDGVCLRVYLNPKENLGELPVKRFFRYVLDSAPSFDETGTVRSLAAVFKGIPSEALLTAGMNIPPAWLVAPKVSIHDLDNIKLSSVKSDITAVYELENILIEGHSRESGQRLPRGAQLVLSTEKDPHFADTIIMANLGYFQFQANPGFYHIKLKEGSSADIFEMESVGAKGYSVVPGDEGTAVTLMDFQGTTLYPRLKRKAGMEEADVLEGDVDGEREAEDFIEKGMRFAESIFGGGGKKEEGQSISDIKHAEINIFSVASGHLYERMLNIMIKSVMAHTKRTVKFWFIEQFLSPKFKNFVPELAKEYKFRYEMVTFKWPHWLRAQKEKQREIWGYKILFLDVLFPLSLDKVIFVDADQIVRTDMIELVRTDLGGAPYGFTPMCDSRTEMEGFRFWKQGYWANYLHGKPYHISALYVVDLKKFRQIAAGDRLRQTYHSLSADPGSLSNLDQDLPNHMQHEIPIHSLSQEWLWCETWCSDESLAEAKTIDLCNNPMTKEPKLDRARRQVPEWTVYDEEIAQLERRWKGVERNENPALSEAEAATQKNPKSRRYEDESLLSRVKEEEGKEDRTRTKTDYAIKDEL